MRSYELGLAPCTSTRERWSATLSWDRSSTAQRHARSWVRRLSVVQADSAGREHAPWLRYIRSVYGEDVRLPFDTRTLRWFWWWAPGARNLTRLEMPVWRSMRSGDVWVPGMRIERHLSHAGFFLQPPGPATPMTKGFADNSMIEVMRVSHPSGETPDSAYGPEAASTTQMWYWHAPGSGIYLSLGRTLAIPNRSELLSALAQRVPDSSPPFTMKRVEVTPEVGLRHCDGCTAETWLDFSVIWPRQARGRARKTAPTTGGAGLVLCDSVRAAGFETVQLFAAFEGQRFEIMDCRGTREQGSPGPPQGASDLLDAPPSRRRPSPTTSSQWTQACPPAAHASLFRAGPRGQWHLCNCSLARPFLNCGECAAPTAVTRLAQPQQSAFEVTAPR
jgi:hypothetical protein